MPGQFPPGFLTLVNNVETISRFLNQPTYVERVLRTLAQQQFIGDVLLTGRFPAEGGSILYEQGETIFADRGTLEAIAPGGEFPLTTTTPGSALLASVRKWGEDTKVTLEAIQRLRFNPVQRGLLKMTNSLVNWFDTICMTAITNAVTQTQAATAAWGGATSNVLLDLGTAVGTIKALKQGYNPDTLVLNTTKYPVLLADKGVQTAMARETTDNPIYTGQMGRIVGLDIMVSPNAPANPLILDRSLFGAIADERGFFSTSWWMPEVESWRLRVGRVSVPIVQEPGAAVSITGS